VQEVHLKSIQILALKICKLDNLYTEAMMCSPCFNTTANSGERNRTQRRTMVAPLQLPWLKGTYWDKAILSSKEIKSITLPLLSYTWLKASVRKIQ